MNQTKTKQQETIERLEALRDKAATPVPAAGYTVSDLHVMDTAISLVREYADDDAAMLQRVFHQDGDNGHRYCAQAAGELMLARIPFSFEVSNQGRGTYELWVRQAHREKALWALELLERRRP